MEHARRTTLPMQTEPLKVALIGAGNIARSHAESVRACPDARLAAVCDVARDKAESLAAPSGGAAYVNAEEMLDRERPQIVLLCTPQMVRLDPIRLCAERGIALFIEKPPADTLERARAIEAVLRQHPVIHSVGFVLRYLDLVAHACELLAGRQILLIRQFYYCRMSLPEAFGKHSAFYYRQELSGGAIVDQAIHLLDLDRYVAQSEVTEVQAFANNLQRPKSAEFTADETMVVNLRLANRVVVSHVHTWAHPGWEYHMEIIATGAHLHLDFKHSRLHGEVDGAPFERATNETWYRAEFEALARAVRANCLTPIRSTYPDAVKSFAVALAINRSLETGERVPVAT